MTFGTSILSVEAKTHFNIFLEKLIMGKKGQNFEPKMGPGRQN